MSNVFFYPNPVNNILFIETDSSIKDASIINALGQYVDKDVEIINASINTSFLKNGLYYLILESEKEIFTERFIVQH